MEININDYFKLDDSHSKVRGFVFGFNDKDELVFAKENMITKVGRKYIMDNGFKISNIPIKVAAIGNSDSITSADMSDQSALGSSILLSSTSGNSLKEAINNSTETSSVNLKYPNGYNVEDDDSQAVLVELQGLSSYFEIKFADNSDISVNCLGLFINFINTDTTVANTLFSRVTFPTQYKSSSEKLTFKYYIYF